MIRYNEVLTYGNQPMTCPYCGNRTQVILDLSHTIEQTQVHKCLSSNYNHKFISQK